MLNDLLSFSASLFLLSFFLLDNLLFGVLGSLDGIRSDVSDLADHILNRVQNELLGNS